jgi:tRNA A-37 threonylcarbamoyl transferase component Bud32
VFVIAKHHELLRQLGLDTMEGVKTFKGELIKNHKGRRDIQRAPGILPGFAGVTLYLKRNWQPYKKDGLKSLCTRGEVWSQSRVEWENSLALQRAGISVAELVAFGEECGLFWENFSFVLTAAARGEMTLEEFLRTEKQPNERQRVFDALALDIRKMHNAGLASPDLFTRHVFLQRGAEPKFCLIDMARLDRRKKLSVKLRARDLAALNITAPLRFVSKEERQRFLDAYGRDVELGGLIQERMKHLLQRRKFADYSAPG